MAFFENTCKPVSLGGKIMAAMERFLANGGTAGDTPQN